MREKGASIACSRAGDVKVEEGRKEREGRSVMESEGAREFFDVEKRS